MKSLLLSAALALPFGSAALAADTFTLDPSHSQIIFSYNHLGYSTTYGMFSGFEGEITWDREAPENSAVTVSMPASMMFTGWEQRDGHFMSVDFFNVAANDLVNFTSTGITLTGDNTADITGDLTMNGTTVSVVLAATLNQVQPYPFGPQQGVEAAGFDATTTLKRSDFGLGAFASAVSDEVEVSISIEAFKKDGTATN